MTIEFRPLANLFPLIEGVEFGELVADISRIRAPRHVLDAVFRGVPIRLPDEAAQP
jgi:hypothetical protein